MNLRQGKRLCLVANTEWYLFNFRLELAKELRCVGWEIIMVSPPGPYAQRLVEEGFEWREWRLDRRGLVPWREADSISGLVKIYREKHPLLVHHFTIKPVMYGSLAGRAAKVPAVVNSITGLGYIFLRPGWQGATMRALVTPLYRLAIKHPNVGVIFENHDDERFFLGNRLVKDTQARVIEGVGVDVERFHPAPEATGPVVVVMPARILWDKGVGILVEASKKLREDRPSSPIRIALVGIPDPGNPTNVDNAQLQQWVAEGLVEHWGFRQDMEQVYRQAHIVCLPSLREGLPTVLIEAAAAGRPIVATDVPGCRNVVENEKNGLLVAPGDPAALAQALARLADDPYLRTQMGANGRLIAEERFANRKIIAATLDVYNSLLGQI